ncbi:MAG: rhomboid family intramembrane serine protease [Pseudomonadota bacterium]
MLVPLSLQPQPVRLFLTACVFFELVALAGLLAGAGDGLRSFLITIGGFWPDLLKGAPPLYPGQPILMFATTAFLHGGVLHLFMNMVGLLWLGPIIVNRLGTPAFWPIAGLSALGAGGLLAALAQSGTPSIGASGVLFGLLGTVAAWELRDRQARRDPLWPLIQQGLVLLAINVALTLSSPGTIAWEAHVGGFLAGAACGLITWRHPLASRWS